MVNPVTDDVKEEAEEVKTDPLHEIRENFKIAEEYWADDRSAALDDLKFRSGEQWPDDIVNQREKDKRPCLTVDKLNQYVRQIVNDGRQNRPSIKVRPIDSGADIATADVFAGIIKHIEDRSCADAAYDCALDSAATSGAGYFRVLSEYAKDDTFDQELVIKRIRNPMSVLIDPASQEADGSDMKFAFIMDTMSEDEFEAKYPGKKPEDFETNDNYADWYGEQVRVAEYWCVKEEDRTLYLMEDGSVIPQARFDELADAGLSPDAAVKEKRNIPKRTVMRAKVSGSEFLEPLTEWVGKYIPILVVWGNEIDIEGKVTHSGIIRPAKDAQRLYNYSRSAFAERVALTPKAPWVAAEGQVEDYEDEWNTANTENHSVLRYKPTSLNGQPVPAPQRVSASDIPAGFAQDMQMSEHDIQGAIGMYSASLGAPSNERSGKAIMARQKEGDTGTFHYHDNLNRAIRHCGRILVDLIPKIYDSNRVIRILGYDGTPSQAQLNPNIPTASQKQGVETLYNLGVGTYDVTITSGPSYNTLRVEAAESMIEMVQAHPELMNVIGDLMVKNMDWPGADEISERLKLLLPPEVKKAEMDKQQQNGLSPEMQQVMQQFDQAMQEKDKMIEQATMMIEGVKGELEKLKEGNELKEKEITIKAADTEIKAYQAETQRMTAVAAAMSPEQVQQIVMQTISDLMTPNTVQFEPPEQPEMQGMPEMDQGEGMANGMPQMPEQQMEQQPNGLGI